MSIMINRIDRRDFLRLTGASLAGLALSAHSATPSRGAALNHYVNITPDGTVTLYSPLADMGQGIYTTLPMIIAEELDLDWEKVRLVLAPTDEAYDNPAHSEQYAADSRSIRGYYLPLRRLGATARLMLLMAAAERWGVDASACETRKAVVFHPPSGRKLGYAELANAAAKLPAPTEVALKPVSEFRLLGNPPPRRDVAPKSLGTLKFGIDITRPGMRYAAIRHVPMRDARILRFERPAADNGDAGEVFALDDQTIVAVADNTWSAQKLVDSVQWELAFPDQADRDDADLTGADNRGALDQAGVPAARQTAQASADQPWDLRREYAVPLLAHAAMEPLACVAEWDGSAMQVWASVQGPQRALSAVAKALNLPPARITVQQVLMGGSFGRRAQVDFVVQAAQIARRVGGAVKLTWSRREDMQHDYYRPSYAARIEATLDERGLLDKVRAKLAGESILVRTNPKFPGTSADPTSVNNLFQNGYRIPGLERRLIRVRQPLRVGFWRSVSSSMNAYFSETFINELAAEKKRDPFEYRLALLADDARARRVLELVRERCDWGTTKNKLYRGVAFCMPYDSYLAQVADIEMLSDSKFRIAKIYTVVDCGFALDPENVRSQIEGSTIFGLTAAAYGEISLRDGRVVQENFDTYPMVRLSQTPPMDTLILSSDDSPGGAGELGVPAIAPAVAAALHRASGKWPRSLPFTRAGFTLA